MRKNLLVFATILCTAFYVNAQDNKALQITADGSWFECTTFQEFTASSVTFEAWVKLDAAATVEDYTAVLDGRYGGLSNSKGLIFKNAGDTLTTSFEWEGAWGYKARAGYGENVVEKGIWQHIAVVVDADALMATFYINGVASGTRAQGSGATDYGNIGAEVSWDTLFVGGGNATLDRTVIGHIDEIRVWSVARTEAEIFDNMTHEIDPSAAVGLLAYYQCNEEPTATILTDASGNGNDAAAKATDGYLFASTTDDEWIVTSIEKYEKDIFSVAPNPAGNVLNINGIDLLNAEYKIYNITGQIIDKSVLNNSTVDVSNLEQGVYFIELNVNNTVASKKFIKQ